MLFLGANLLANLSIIITYENFITFGLVTAIPVCAGKYFCYFKIYLTNPKNDI